MGYGTTSVSAPDKQKRIAARQVSGTGVDRTGFRGLAPGVTQKGKNLIAGRGLGAAASKKIVKPAAVKPVTKKKVAKPKITSNINAQGEDAKMLRQLQGGG